MFPAACIPSSTVSKINALAKCTSECDDNGGDAAPDSSQAAENETDTTIEYSTYGTTGLVQSVNSDVASMEPDVPATISKDIGYGTCMAQESQRRDSARTAFMTDVDTRTVRKDIGCAASLQNDPQEPQYRNIVIVGKIGAGKATIANQILGENKFTVFPRVQSVTKLVDTRAVYNEKSESEPREKGARAIPFRYNIQVIDTVGVLYTMTREKITEHIETFLSRCPEGIHLVIFVFKNDRFGKQDEEAFSVFMNCKFADCLSEISALFITCCEALDPTTQQEIRDDFRSNDRLKQISGFMKKGIYTVGFPNIEAIKEELRCFCEEGMKADRKKLMDLVAECGQPQLSLKEFQNKGKHRNRYNMSESCLLQ